MEKLFRGSNFVQKFGPSYKKRRLSGNQATYTVATTSAPPMNLQQQQPPLNAITYTTIPVTKTTNSKTIQHVTINPTPGQLPNNIRTRPLIRSIQSPFQNGTYSRSKSRKF